MKLSEKQLGSLQDYAEGYEQPDLDRFYNGNTFDYLNRDRVISALIRKGLIDAQQKITEAGLSALSKAQA